MRTGKALAAVVSLVPVCGAAATTYFDRATFNGAFPGLALQDFNSATATQRDFVDFTVASGTAFGTACGTTTNGFPSRVAFGFNSDDTLEIDFVTPVQAVGFQVADYDFFDSHALSCEVVVRGPTGTLLAHVPLLATGGKSMNTFIGFGDLGPIGRVLVSDLIGQPGMLAFDDVAYGVPAPGAAGVLLAGVVAVGRRRRD